MARSHHRKKHKEHLRQFRHSHDTVASKTKGKATYTFLIIGAIVGLLIGFLASNGAVAWTAIGLVAGGVAGYFIGSKTDKSK